MKAWALQDVTKLTSGPSASQILNPRIEGIQKLLNT